MNWKLTILAMGCMTIGVAGTLASRHLMADTPEATRQPPTPPLFAQAATQTPTHALWPRGEAVAYHADMRALLTMAATPKVAAREAEPEPPARNARTQEAHPPRNTSSRRAHRNRNRGNAPGRDTVEVEVRDRYGRRIRVERIEREAIDRYRAYAPSRRQGPFFGPLRPY
jgi:hypothetical protein